jgi:hypothetical protein
MLRGMPEMSYELSSYFGFCSVTQPVTRSFWLLSVITTRKERKVRTKVGLTVFHVFTGDIWSSAYKLGSDWKSHLSYDDAAYYQ